MPRMGDIADDTSYGYSDLGIPVGAAVTGENTADYGRGDLGQFAMGALAQRDAYRPTDARGTDLWGYQMGGTVVPPQEIDKAINMVMATSGGGLKTDAVKGAMGSVLKPREYPPGHILHGMKIEAAPPPWEDLRPAAEEFTAPANAVPLGPELKNTFADPRLRAKAENIWEKYPQYAEAYPDTGPPALMEKRPDPKKPGSYLTTKPLGEVPYTSWDEAVAMDATPRYFFEKKLLPEVEKFAKDRNVVQREMDLHGYTPYFDPAKRADINPADYGPFRDTRVEAQPKTQATTDKFDKLYGTDEARARLQAGYEKGQTLEGSDRWYWMKQLQDKYVDVLGPVAGKEAFKKEFSGMMAATTGGASPYDNFLMSHWANYLNKQGKNVAQRAYEMPFPIGGRFASGNMKQAQKYIDEGMVGFNPVKNPKRFDFDNALAGDRNAGVIDEQMFGAIMPGQTIPQWYGPATNVLHQEANKVGMGHNSGGGGGARDFQDVAWAGLKALKEEARLGVPFKYEGPMINQINRSIETTHRLTGMPVEEIVVRGLIKKEIPMYGIGAAGAMGALADQDNYKLPTFNERK